MNNDMEIVSAITRAIAERVGKDRFQMWLAEATVSLQERTLSIRVAEAFKLERVRRIFRGDLLAAAQSVLGYEPDLVLAIDHAAQKAAKEAAAEPATPSDTQLELFAQGSQPPEIPAETETTPATVPFRPLRRSFASLDALVVGDGNRVAHAAAASLLARLGKVSPLLFYGPTGCGKSHLLEGIWTTARKSGQVKRVIYLTAEQFTTHFVEALRGSGLPSFRSKYRDVELLLIDDVQFFAGKQSTLVELLYTIDTLLREGRQIVLAADRQPADLKFLGADIAARISGGLVCGIEPADYAMREEILNRRAAKDGLSVPREVLAHLAAELAGDGRQLAGALNRLSAVSHAHERPITMELAETALVDIFAASRRAVRLPDIVGAVCHLFGLEPEQIHSPSRSPTVSH
ncbi:MAG TPA: DnaA/Hda family protein, partial [Pirellulaceae bacterium]|nr:DnaA/Hda family protein [Pirellulaceae bacterium]